MPLLICGKLLWVPVQYKLTMSEKYKQQLERNIGKYSWYKVFTKRVYLPLIAIQLVNVGKVTVGQLAFIAIAASIVQVLLDIPTGYIADKWGNKRAILTGASITAASPLFYIFMPNFLGGLLAALLFFGGYAFQSGAIEAFMHDTLVALGKEHEYAKVMGRAQSYGLIGNVFLIALIPATYSINHSLPFLLGFVSLVIMLWLASTFTFVAAQHNKARKNPIEATKSIITPQNIALFIFAGAMAGVSNRGGEYRELLYQSIGVKVALFGLLLSLGSIIGAVMGRYIHLLDRLKPLTFYLLDVTFMASCMALVGISKSPLLSILGFTLFSAYGRVRLIVFQAKLLHDIQHVYKATLISSLNLFTVVGEIGAVTLLAKLIGFKHYTVGYLLFGIAIFGIGLSLWFFIWLENSRKIQRPASNQA
jgi:MFS family permease